MEPSYFTTPPGGQPIQSSDFLPSLITTESSSSPAIINDPTATILVQPATTYPDTFTAARSSPRRTVYARLRRDLHLHPSLFRWVLIFLSLALSLHLYTHLSSSGQQTLLSSLIADFRHSTSSSHLSRSKHRDPLQWLAENSYPNDLRAPQPKAALISLVRNEELDGILQSMRQLEFHWNRRYRYPWVFFNERPFSEEFKAATSNATSSRTEYHVVPRAHWLPPPHINQTRYHNSLDYLSLTSVGKGHLLSYHAMIRWQSGYFYQHPALQQYDYYWRVEPDVHFFCDIPYDPFRFLRANDLVYGFNMAILDDARSFADLWTSTRNFILLNSHLLHVDADLDWLLDARTGLNYNNCQFFSNFEIGSLSFFRENEGVRRYFEHLEQEGGFYYSRWGDAPVHTLMVALFAAPEQVWWFRDVGYQHDIARHCPPPDGSVFAGMRRRRNLKGRRRSGARGHDVDESVRLNWPQDRCACEATSLDENFYKLVPMESPQIKPADSCIRLWLGGEWLSKKDGWSQDAERILGGDGYGGYVLDGM